MLLLKRKPDNVEDKFAVAVMKSGTVVGHVPKTLEDTSVSYISVFEVRLRGGYRILVRGALFFQGVLHSIRGVRKHA